MLYSDPSYAYNKHWSSAQSLNFWALVHDMRLNLMPLRSLLVTVLWGVTCSIYTEAQVALSPMTAPCIFQNKTLHTHISQDGVGGGCVGMNLCLTSLETGNGEGGGSWGDSHLFRCRWSPGMCEVYLWKWYFLKPEIQCFKFQKCKRELGREEEKWKDNRWSPIQLRVIFVF